MGALWEDAEKYARGSHLGKVILGIDPGFSNFGYCLVSVDPWKILARGVLKSGPTKEWRHGIPYLLTRLSEVLPFHPDYVGVENIEWYGKRKGVIALAHLAGAVGGFFFGHGEGAPVYYFPARFVKPTAAAITAKHVKGWTTWTDHEQDAYALVLLVLDQLKSVPVLPKNTNGKNNHPLVVTPASASR